MTSNNKIIKKLEQVIEQIKNRERREQEIIESRVKSAMIQDEREENKKLRDSKTPRLNYKWFMTSLKDLPSEWNEEWDVYTYKIYDPIIDQTRIGKMVWYKNDWVDLSRIIRMEADERDEIINNQKQEISKLKKELQERLKQVEDLQSSYKTLQKDIIDLEDDKKRLISKLDQMTEEYDEEYDDIMDKIMRWYFKY